MLWHTAWLNGLLDGAFFWIGDARRQCAGRPATSSRCKSDTMKE